jgi:hypothetical protein
MKRILMVVVLALGLCLCGAWGQQDLGHRGHNVNKNLIFPHLALGEGYTTAVVLMNPGQSPQAVVGVLYFFDAAGNPLVVNDGTQEADHFDVELVPHMIWYREFTPLDPALVVGWALFQVEGNGNGGGNGNGHGNGHGNGNGGKVAWHGDPHEQVFGTLIYSHFSGDVLDTQVGVLGSHYRTGYFRGQAVPVLAGVNVNTGVALVNIWSEAIEVNLQLMDATGTLVAEATVALDPGHQQAQFVTEIFPDVDLTNFTGILEIRTEGEGLVVVGLLASGPVLTSIPTVFIPDAQPEEGSIADIYNPYERPADRLRGAPVIGRLPFQYGAGTNTARGLHFSPYTVLSLSTCGWVKQRKRK